MTQDVLAPYRRPGSRPAGFSQPPREAQPEPGYRAFGVASGSVRPLRLEIRPKDGLAVARLYSGLSEIAYDRTDYTGILLVFAARLVKLRGRNLRPVIEALLAGTCEYLAELCDGDAPQDGAPVIERIEGMNPQSRAGAPSES